LRRFGTTRSTLMMMTMMTLPQYHIIIVPRSASGITFIRRVCITAVYTVSNVADDDANSYIYYTFIILHYTVHIFLLSCISTQLPSARALSLLPLCRIFAVSVACPCSQSAWATTASPAPLPGRVVVGRRSHSSDHHIISYQKFIVRPLIREPRPQVHYQSQPSVVSVCFPSQQ